MNLTRSTSALLAVLALAVGAACSNSSTPAPGRSPVPSSSPSLSPSTSPSPISSVSPSPVPSTSASPAANSTTEPITPGSYNFFITVGGYGGGIKFPNGVSPSNDQITLTTQITQPLGYPTTIPSGQPGAGTSPVAPWLTFQLAQYLTIPSSQEIYVLPCGSYTAGQYYIALFDITENYFIVSIKMANPSEPGACTASDILQRAIKSNRIRPQDLNTDQFYIGVFH